MPQTLANDIGRSLVSGELALGEPLPSEQPLLEM
jgi:DNA-binding FadR family transcriptional regulator